MESVYAIRAGEYVKIGRAGNVESRLRALQTANPLELELIGSLAVMDAAALEKRMHAMLREYRVRGEWFKIDASSLDMIDRLLVNPRPGWVYK